MHRHPTHSAFSLVELLISVGIIVLIFVIMFPVYGNARRRSKATRCMTNQRQVVTAILMQAENHGNHFPLANEVWKPFDDSKRVLRCPDAPTQENGYGYFTTLAGVRTDAFAQPDEASLTMDCTDTASNLIRTPADIAYRHHGHVAYVSFADGHIERRNIAYGIYSAGKNNCGQVGDGTTKDCHTFVPIRDPVFPVAVSTGVQHSLVLTSMGSLWAWGDNSSGQLGVSSAKPCLNPIKIKGLDDVVKISSSAFSSFALRADGTVWVWGSNIYGELGDGTHRDRDTPRRVPGLSDVVDISGGIYHVLAVRRDGSVWAWGNNEYRQCGISSASVKYQTTPVRVHGLTSIQTVSAGYAHSLALTKDGQILAWGANQYGQLGNGTGITSATPQPVLGLPRVNGISADTYSIAFTDDTIFAWGIWEPRGPEELGKLRPGDPVLPWYTARPIDLLSAGTSPGRIRTACIGSFSLFVLHDDGVVWAFGDHVPGHDTQDKIYDMKDMESLGKALKPVNVAWKGQPIDYLQGVQAIANRGFHSMVIVNPK